MQMVTHPPRRPPVVYLTLPCKENRGVSSRRHRHCASGANKVSKSFGQPGSSISTIAKAKLNVLIPSVRRLCSSSVSPKPNLRGASRCCVDGRKQWRQALDAGKNKVSRSCAGATDDCSCVYYSAYGMYCTVRTRCNSL